MSRLPGVSIIIPNYNYARYVAQAIDSALAQDHPDVEVIVVDDGSTDDSRAVIEGYAGHVRMVFLTENRGQMSAYETGWPMARHEILIFLDSDDMLLPHTCSTIARAWRPGVSKIQFPMFSIDGEGRDLGHVAPKYQPGLTTARLRADLQRTGTCATTQGSGNAYAKHLLAAASPLGGVTIPDTLLEIHAVFHGEVLTLNEPLAKYRMHGANHTMQSTVDAQRFLKSLDTYEEKITYLETFFASRGMAFDANAARSRSIWRLEYQMAASRLLPRHHPRRVPPLAVLRDAASAVRGSESRIKRKALLFAWFGLMALGPRAFARRLAAVRFVITKRPRWVETLLGSRRQTIPPASSLRPSIRADGLERTAP